MTKEVKLYQIGQSDHWVVGVNGDYSKAYIGRWLDDGSMSVHYMEQEELGDLIAYLSEAHDSIIGDDYDKH